VPTPLAAALAGLLAGGIHVLIGADHRAAVAPLAVEGGRRAWRAGFRWGVGHAGGVTLVGLAALALRGAVPVEALSAHGEGLVGVALIAIGVWAGMRSLASLRDERNAPGHVHDHVEGHGHLPHGHGHRHAHTERAALAVGLLHGSAGAAHVIGILPALALPPLAGLVYLAAFGVGTVAAMAGFAAAVGGARLRLGRSASRAYAGLMGACALASVVVGIYWIVG
jgi:hypothetical protein